MSGRKRTASVDMTEYTGSSIDCDLSDDYLEIDDLKKEMPLKKKRGITITMVEKWKAINDKAMNTSTWLCYDKADETYVSSLKCRVCIWFVDKIRSTRNFNPAFYKWVKKPSFVIC